jgi:hypothetical protein
MSRLVCASAEFAGVVDFDCERNKIKLLILYTIFGHEYKHKNYAHLSAEISY